MNVVCKNCGKGFKALTKRIKYCSKKCRKKYYLPKKVVVEKNCLQCNKKFNSSVLTKKFCSRECKNSFHRQGNIKNKICPYCNKKFKCTNDSKIYCSREHYVLAKVLRDKKYYSKKKEGTLNEQLS